MSAELRDKRHQRQLRTAQRHRQRRRNSRPTCPARIRGRWVAPEALADVILFLALGTPPGQSTVRRFP